MSERTAQWEPGRLASLTAWYGRFSNLDPSALGKESRVLEIQPASTNGQILNALQDLLDGRTGATQTASVLASLVLSDDNPDGAWSFMSGHTCMAAEFHARPKLEKLAGMLISLTRLPHHLPSPSYPTATGPGDTAFAELPNFGFTLSEYMQGPRQYLCRLELVTRNAQIAAARRWQNISTFAAIVTRYHYEQALPRCANMSRLARSTLASALEDRMPGGEDLYPDTSYIQLRDRPVLWISAAASWISIAGRYILEAALKDPWNSKVAPGRQWVSVRGDDLLSSERWSFWRRKLALLAENQALDLEVRDALAMFGREIDFSVREDTVLL